MVSRNRHQPRWIAWLALVAMLAMAVLPAASRAWLSAQNGDWVEICSAQGMRWVSLGSKANQPAEGKSALKPMAESCAACQLQAHAAGLPPAAVVVPLLGLQHEQPRLFLQAPRLLAVWRTAQSRGPPQA